MREDPFDPEQFRALGHRWVDVLADHLVHAHAGDQHVLDWQPPAQILADWPPQFPAPDAADADGLLHRVIAASNHLHHPRYLGHQVASTLPFAALCDLASAVLNNGSIYEMGPVAMAMERALAQWLAQQIGFGPSADAIFTSGGSLGNLTALLAARSHGAGFDAWRDGAAGGPPLAVLVSEHAHYSIDRAVKILGWGEAGCIAIPLDGDHRMNVDALEPALAQARDAGRRVIAVVASAGAVPTGAFDPLTDIAEFCARHGLWFHVDGAHGASVVLSTKHRHLAAGIERADSVVWDAHKMLLMPSLLTAVVFRDWSTSYATFVQDATYLFNEPTPWADTCLRTMECTKNTMAFKLYATLAHYGPQLLSNHIDHTFALASRLAELLRAASDFELALDPPANIVMFRYRVHAGRDADALQDAIRVRLRDRGEFFIVRAELADKPWLRVSIMNPRTSERDLIALIEAVRRAAAELS